MSGGAVLSPNDLLQIARDPSVESRRSLAISLTELFETDEVALGRRERTLAGEILGGLIRAFETKIRRELAERLAQNPRIPRDVILMLANDQIEVARPILLNSDHLETEDLIEIIELRGLDHQLAVACREALCEDICEALVETRNPVVIETMLRNPGAEIVDATLTYLIEQARDVAGYQQALALRKGLTPRMVRRLYVLVSDAIKEHILENYDVQAADLEDELEPMIAARSDELDPMIAARSDELDPMIAARSDELDPMIAARSDEWDQAVAAEDPFAVAQFDVPDAARTDDQASNLARSEEPDGAAADENPPDTEEPDGAAAGENPPDIGEPPNVEEPRHVEEPLVAATAVSGDGAGNGRAAADAGPDLAARLANMQDVTPELLINLLREERFDLFEQRFGRLSGLDSARLKDVIYGAGGRDLAVTCRALDMAKTDFAVILFLTRKGSGREVEDPREIAKVMNLFESTKPEAAMDQLKLWRRSNGFVEAAKALGRAYDDRARD